MKRYAPTTPRKALVLAAAALSALTIAVTVLLPASLVVETGSPATLAMRAAAQPPTAVSIQPARIEVIGVRSRGIAANTYAGGRA